MGYQASKHQYRRISVGPDHTVRFRFRGRDLDWLPITNLSASGCFVILPGDFSHQVSEGLLLTNFVFGHEDLPPTPICSKIVRVTHGLSEFSDNDIGIGVEFLSTSDHYTEWLDAYVSAYYAFQSSAVS